MTANFGPGFNSAYLIRTDSIGHSGCYEVNHPISHSARFDTTMDATANIVFFPVIIDTPVFSMSGGGTSWDICNLNNVDELTYPVIEIYPNPSSGNLIFRCNGLVGEATVSIVDLYENQFFSKIFHLENANPIEVRGLSPGIYFLKILKGASVSYHKILIQ